MILWGTKTDKFLLLELTIPNKMGKKVFFHVAKLTFYIRYHGNEWHFCFHGGHFGEFSAKVLTVFTPGTQNFHHGLKGTLFPSNQAYRTITVYIISGHTKEREYHEKNLIQIIYKRVSEKLTFLFSQGVILLFSLLKITPFCLIQYAITRDRINFDLIKKVKTRAGF